MTRLLGIGGCLAGVPVAVLAFLAACGWASFWPALAGMTVCLAAALAVALFWERDLDRLTEAIRELGRNPGLAPRSADTVLLRRLGREVGRLGRRLAAHAAQQERILRSDTLILERLPDPVLVVAADRTPRRMNPAAREGVGDDLPAVLRHPGLRAAIDRAIAGGATQRVELGLRAPVPRDLSATIVPLNPPLTDGGQALVVLSDRTRERRMERMRADFVANVSHELRTPLASMIGFIETLLGPAADDPPAQKRFLEIMADQGARMNRLIDDLLSLSRIELMEHQAPSDPLDLAELVRGVAAGFEPRLAQREVRLALEIEDGLPPVAGDADQMAQVLQNLLDNALKYGRAESTLSVTVARAAGAPRWPARAGIVIAVADQGAGIPKEHLPRLTERFYRVDKGRSRAVGGTGLGLAIVKHIVNRHRGQLLIESAENVGTTVSIWLPAVPAPARAAEPG